ncbi:MULTISPECIES: glycosyltransferase [unclassified Streptomyces]|uniref:glycosyltransferase n=1 Tax=unclassified Streptomyces TaxID=2593676 RepID=UPI00225A6D59|nr:MULTISPECIES: glycosyltransferase [unclassified Streptomyces]WSP55729.1 glycosyltransferase [Streptomyces sp. NBC_01241]WSU23535.1 glycosyltransferase [Streptomyces sp. NBC_01108]MCX4787433.1 glycosyltransferase [Streptomyces sp. NBC_01221]MCX4796782.1 glycosyltransferase [Streptomyces sp. NBC_01242]WSJ38005.1 glycosyltransferase [Streptomyces sp. NBC_01321]
MKPSICLCMIVKNEAAVIERCLTSVRNLIDTWVISDTGSTDGTQQLIRNALDGLPGELHEEPWVNFGHNRTLNIEHAHGKADYLLLLDADLVIRREGPLPPLTADSYMLRHEGTTEYRIKRLVRGDLPWRYVGVTHEYLTTDRRDDQRNLDALVIEDYADGGSRHDKFERDARLLGAELKRDPSNARTVFYLAQTMRDMGNIAKAAALYERRAQMGGWDEEVYYALLQAGILKAEADDWPAAMDALSRAWESRPQRLEACYELSSRLRRLGRYRTAHAFVRAALDREAPPDDLLFVQPWVYRWGLLFEFSITAYWVGDYAGSLRACDRLLAMPDLPDAYREQTRANRNFAEQRQSARNTSSVFRQAGPAASPVGAAR